MVLWKTVEGQSLAEVLSQYLGGSGKLPPITSQEAVRLSLGIVQAGSIEDAMQGSLHFSLSLLWHASQHIPNAVHHTALPRYLWPYITNSSQKSGVTIRDDELRRFEPSFHQVVQHALPGISALPTSKAQVKYHSFAVSADATRADGADKVISTAISEWGRVDILVNSAGVAIRTASLTRAPCLTPK